MYRRYVLNGKFANNLGLITFYPHLNLKWNELFHMIIFMLKMQHFISILMWEKGVLNLAFSCLLFGCN